MLQTGAAFIPPALCISPHTIVTAVIANTPQIIMDTRQSEPFFARTSFVRLQHRIKLFCEKAQLWQRLGGSVIAKLRYFGAQNLPYRIPRDAAIPANLFNAFLMNKMIPSDLRNHNNHPLYNPDILIQMTGTMHNQGRGSKSNADLPV